MDKAKVTLYVDPEVNVALKDYARRYKLSFGAAAGELLKRALFGSLDPGTEAILVPEIRKAVAEVVKKEVRLDMHYIMGSHVEKILDEVGKHVTRGVDQQTDRLAGMFVMAGRDSYASHRLARDILVELTGQDAVVDDRDKQIFIEATKRYTSEGLRQQKRKEEAIRNGGEGK